MAKSRTYSKKKRFFIGGGVALATLIAAGALYLSHRSKELQHVAYIEALQHQVVQLEAARQVLDRGKLPYDWPAAAFVSEASINRILDASEGSKFEVNKVPNVEFEIASIDAIANRGSIKIELTVTASHKRTKPLRISIKSSSLLSLRKINPPDESGVAGAVLRLSIIEIRPELAWSTVTAEGSRFANDIVSAHAVEAIADSLTFTVPLRLPASIPIEVDDVDHIKAGDAEFDVHISMQSIELENAFYLTAPLAAKNGLWVLANDGAELNLPDVHSLPSDINALRSRISSLESVIEKKSENIEKPEAGVALWLRRDVLEKPFNDLNRLPQEQRRVSIKLDGIKGYLLDETANVLGGEAGIRSSLRSANGTLDVGPLVAQWDGNKGLQVKAPVSANATAVVDSVIETIVGGGVSFDSTLTGTAADQLDIDLGLRNVRAGTNSALMLGPVFGCKHTKLTVETTGTIKIGVEMYMPIVKKPAKATVLIDSSPRFMPRSIDSAKKEIELVNNAWIRSTWSDIRSDIKPNGYLVSANLNVSMVEKPEMANDDVLSDAFASAWALETTPKCPPPRQMKVLFAGQDFGPNNELVKALVKMARGVERAGHTVKVTYDRVEQVFKKPSDAGVVLKDSYDSAEDEVKRTVKKLDPTNW